MLVPELFFLPDNGDADDDGGASSSPPSAGASPLRPSPHSASFWNCNGESMVEDFPPIPPLEEVPLSLTTDPVLATAVPVAEAQTAESFPFPAVSTQRMHRHNCTERKRVMRLNDLFLELRAAIGDVSDVTIPKTKAAVLRCAIDIIRQGDAPPLRLAHSPSPTGEESPNP
jgi:hypothetical protein